MSAIGTRRNLMPNFAAEGAKILSTYALAFGSPPHIHRETTCPLALLRMRDQAAGELAPLEVVLAEDTPEAPYTKKRTSIREANLSPKLVFLLCAMQDPHFK